MFESLELFVGQHLDLEQLSGAFTALRYERVKRSVRPGQYSIRGGIVDLYPVDFDGPVRIDFDDDEIVRIASVNIHTGKSIWQHKIIIILPNRPEKSRNVFSEDIPLNNFIDVSSGDYVVHNTHGVGRFLGIEEIENNHVVKEHLVIEYDGGDKLFVPKHDMRLVQKYVSFNKRPPRLYKLGSKEWLKVKRRIRQKIQRLAGELLRTQALRTSLGGYRFSRGTDWQEEFEARFPFEETPDQKKAWEDVRADMESPYPMDRLLCGDVGYGKTEVAMRAAFKAVMDNKQVAILVPTTILAEQHAYNFSKRMRDFPVKVGMISRFRSKSEQYAIIEDAANGRIDILIGTHRLLSRDIQFKDIGLIVIDEEQRFGVRAKERLKRLKLLTDILSMSATPIPRTLHMSLTGAKDMSVISTPPEQRIPVKTKVIDFDESVIKKAILREIRRKGQVFFLHNRIEDINRIAKIIQSLAPKARVGVGHGQMPSRELEDVMLRFLEGDIDILVSTSIIESGIDIPNANTLIINRADRFGLSDLHQLRGRVGRSTVQAYAYFIKPFGTKLSDNARSRIAAIERYSGLGAGFHIAFEDLQLRGAGNLLGEEQSGYISTVGFDLYCRLLKESIEHLKQQGQAHDSNTNS